MVVKFTLFLLWETKMYLYSTLFVEEQGSSVCSMSSYLEPFTKQRSYEEECTVLEKGYFKASTISSLYSWRLLAS